MKGRTFRQLRRRLGWTQAELADVLDVHRESVSRWERNFQRIPRMASLALELLVEREEGK